MTVAAVKTSRPAPAKAAASSRPRGLTLLTPMRKATAKSIRTLADQVQKSHPGMITHEHLRDAAKQVEAGNEDGAQGHLRAAMFSLTPQSLMRNGLHADDAHQAARQVMHGVHRHLLLTKNITAAAARNQEAIRRDSGDGAAVPPPRPDPNAGYGPGALAQKPTVRQPPGDQALNAPATADGGGSDPSTADPGGQQAKAGKQFAARDEAGAVLDLVGTGGWQHGWKPGGPTAADHDKAAKLHTQAAAKAKDPAAKAKHMRRAKAHTQIAQKLRSLSAPAGLAYDWHDVERLIEFSAKTAALEVTPSPRGKPGGGLYDVTGLEHMPYFQNLVKALIEKRGMPSGKAYAIAYGALRKWGAGGGHVSPEVQSAAAGALAGEKAAGATAKASHGHAVTWGDLDGLIEMAAAPAPAAGSAAKQQAAANEARVAAGSAGGGQFTAGGGGQPAKGKPPAKGKAAAKPTAAQAHAAHVAHVAHVNGVSTQKASLMVTAQDDRAKAAALIKQRDALMKAMASAGGATSSGQSGSTTSANSTTSSTAPAATASTASTTAAAPSATTSTAAAPAASTSATSTTAMKAQVAQLNTQISSLLQAASQAQAQASKMK